MKIQKIGIMTVALTCSFALNSLAFANNDGSEEISTGGASIAGASLASVKGEPLQASVFFVTGAALIVVGVGTAVGNTVSVVIQNSVDGSKAVVQASVLAVKEIGVSVGNSIKVVAASTGYVLLASGKVLAFIPNAMGNELLYQSKLSK